MAADRQCAFVDGRRGVRRAGRLVGRVDHDRRLVVDKRRDFLEHGRSVSEIGRRQQVAKWRTRIERADRHGEIAARRLRQPGGGLGLGVDQQRGEVGGGHLDVADDELGHKHRAVDDDHLSAVGQVDDKIATDRMDVVELDPGGQCHDAINARHHALRVGLDHERRGRRCDPLRGGNMSVPAGHARRSELLSQMLMNRMSLRAA